MGTTFVNIGENGFWILDSVLELWLRLLCLHIEDVSEDDKQAIVYSIRNGWLLASRGYFGGCVPVDLDEAVKTEIGKGIVLQAIHSLLTVLRKAPKKLDKDTLNIIGIEGTIVQDIDPSTLIEIGEAFIDLIQGRITNKANDTSFMPGSQRN